MTMRADAGAGAHEPVVGPTLRERTRRAVQAELVAVATRLFVEQGFEGTTIDQIAETAGVSRRSFFRYFPTKEDLVLSKYDTTGERLVTILRDRPQEEPLWVSLRHVLDDVVQYASDADRAAAMLELERVVATSDSLRGAYLARIDGMQRELAAVARTRAADAGHRVRTDDPAPRAIVGAAFACLRAATESSAETGADLGAALDVAMAAVAPLGGPAAITADARATGRRATRSGPAPTA